MKVVSTRNDSEDEGNELPEAAPRLLVLKMFSQPRGGIHNTGDWITCARSQDGTPNEIPTPKNCNAEDTYFDREVCRFFWGEDSMQEDISVSVRLSWTS